MKLTSNKSKYQIVTDDTNTHGTQTCYKVFLVLSYADISFLKTNGNLIRSDNFSIVTHFLLLCTGKRLMNT